MNCLQIYLSEILLKLLLRDCNCDTDNYVMRWMPFIILILSAVGLSGYFFFTGKTSVYRPTIHDPAIIYREACAECHGQKGEGEGLFFPGLMDTSIARKDVIEAVREGRFMMPAFTEIPDSTLKNLVVYIINKGFR